MDKEKILRSSKEYIIEAFFIILGTKKFEKISILEVCEKAGVSRVTFYKYFKKKSQIINVFFQIHEYLFNNYIEQIKNSDNYYELIAKYYLDTVNSNNNKIKALIFNNMEYILLDKLSEYTNSFINKNNIIKNDINKSMFIGAIFNIAIDKAKGIELNDDETIKCLLNYFNMIKK